MERLGTTCKLIVAAACFTCVGHALAADDLVIPGDNSKNLLDKVPLQITGEIEWNKKENDNRLREKIVRILSDANLFIEEPEALQTEQQNSVQSKIETDPDGQNGEVP